MEEGEESGLEWKKRWSLGWKGGEQELGLGLWVRIQSTALARESPPVAAKACVANSSEKPMLISCSFSMLTLTLNYTTISTI